MNMKTQPGAHGDSSTHGMLPPEPLLTPTLAIALATLTAEVLATLEATADDATLLCALEALDVLDEVDDETGEEPPPLDATEVDEWEPVVAGAPPDPASPL